MAHTSISLQGADDRSMFVFDGGGGGGGLRLFWFRVRTAEYENLLEFFTIQHRVRTLHVVG